jgi:hypothetical protein
LLNGHDKLAKGIGNFSRFSQYFNFSVANSEVRTALSKIYMKINLLLCGKINLDSNKMCCIHSDIDSLGYDIVQSYG